MQQMLQREDFKTRIAEGKEVRLHETQYPILQGWDSVVVKADVEIGGTDQLFNILVGRDLQKEENMPQQVVILMPLLEGLDGTKKMSKSSHNYVGVVESPTEMVNKLMSISDDLMDKYYLMLLGQKRDQSQHPRDAKLDLARQITTRYHSENEAKDAVQQWLNRSKGDQAAGATEIALTEFSSELTILTLTSEAFIKAFNLKKSNGELKKQSILPGAIQLNGKKLTDPNASITIKQGDILRLSKKHTIKLI